MFFAYPEKVYVIVNVAFKARWYLKDADTRASYITVRKWTMNPKKAVRFDHKEDAENVGLLILNEDEFIIQSIT